MVVKLSCAASYCESRLLVVEFARHRFLFLTGLMLFESIGDSHILYRPPDDAFLKLTQV